MSISAPNSAIWSTGRITASQTRQVLPGKILSATPFSVDPSTGDDGGGSDASSLSTSIDSSDSASQTFEKYMKETPIERMQDAWLKEHGITRDQYEHMKPEEKQKVQDQMAKDLSAKIKDSAASPSQAASLNIVV